MKPFQMLSLSMLMEEALVPSTLLDSSVVEMNLILSTVLLTSLSQQSYPVYTLKMLV